MGVSGWCQACFSWRGNDGLRVVYQLPMLLDAKSVAVDSCATLGGVFLAFQTPGLQHGSYGPHKQLGQKKSRIPWG